VALGRHTHQLRPGRATRTLAAALMTGTLIAATPLLTQAQTTRTVQVGVFTEAQAGRGKTVYAEHCASCHGATLAGGQAPALVGDTFVSNWQTEPLTALISKIRNTMPADAPGQLTASQTADVVAHLLKSGGFPAGSSELASAEAAGSAIGWPARAGGAPGPVLTAGAAPAFTPMGNVAQLMRGVFFPNSNLIFTVQTHDPGAPAPPPAAGAQANGFSWVDWGAGIYGGWQLVDNAAIALADVSPLMLSPGLRCENGRPAPVADADWIKFTEQMIAVARRTYRASQSRSQEAVSDATGDLSDACAACHQAYRDVRTPGRAANPGDPANNAARCMSR
jgi:mono/diheme cytochrome c family protein